jgi:hypothetical protein
MYTVTDGRAAGAPEIQYGATLDGEHIGSLSLQGGETRSSNYLYDLAEGSHTLVIELNGSTYASVTFDIGSCADTPAPSVTTAVSQCAASGVSNGSATVSVTDLRTGANGALAPWGYGLEFDGSRGDDRLPGSDYGSAVYLEVGESTTFTIAGLAAGAHTLSVYREGIPNWVVKTFTVQECGTTPPVTTPAVPTPVIHIGEVCLADGGTDVKPYDLSFTWKGEQGRTYGVTYSFNKVNADGSLGEQVNGGFTDFRTDSLVIWPNTEGLSSDAVTRGLARGTYAVSAYLTDFSGITPTGGGAVGGSEGDVKGATATTEFTVKDCDTTPPAAAPKAALSASTAAAGAPVTVTVSGAHPGEKLAFALHSEVVALGTITADANGTASLTFRIPDGFAAGEHTVTVDGEWTHLEQGITVTAPNTSGERTTGAAGHRTPSAVQTDGDTTLTLGLAAGTVLMALLTAGGAALIWRRRARH